MNVSMEGFHQPRTILENSNEDIVSLKTKFFF